MDREEVLKKIKEAGSKEDIVEARTILSELTPEIEKAYEHSTELETELTTLRESNETLRQANMQLFLQVGSVKPTTEIIKDKTGLDQEEKKTRRYEDLFDEKGRLK